MNSRYFSSNKNSSHPHYTSPNHQRFGDHRQSPNYQSPPWDPKQNNISAGGYSDAAMQGRNEHRSTYYNSPNSHPFQQNKNSRYTSTPNRRSGGASNYNNSGFMPLPYSPNFTRHTSPYPRGGGNYSRGRSSYNRGQPRYSGGQHQENIEKYFTQSMLQDPWENCHVPENSLDEIKDTGGS